MYTDKVKTDLYFQKINKIYSKKLNTIKSLEKFINYVNRSPDIKFDIIFTSNLKTLVFYNDFGKINITDINNSLEKFSSYNKTPCLDIHGNICTYYGYNNFGCYKNDFTYTNYIDFIKGMCEYLKLNISDFIVT